MKKIKKYSILHLFFFVLILSNISIYSQTPIYENIKVSDFGTSNSIGDANTSRNIVTNSQGKIYAVYRNNTQIRFAKSENRGQTFSSSILVSTINNIHIEPEITVNNSGIIFIAWNDAGNI